MPEFYPFLWQNYRTSSHLFFGDHILPPQRGVQQDDPLGPAVFALTTSQLAQSMTSELNVWFSDDCTQGGHVEAVLADLRTVSAAAGKYGLTHNLQKCEVLAANDPKSHRA